MLYYTLLDGRASFVYFYWPLWRGPVTIYLCILWRFLVTWGPCEHPDNSFGEEVVLTSGSLPPSFGFVVISKNVLRICAPPFAVSSCALLSLVSPSDYSVAQVDVETMVVEVSLMDLQSLFAIVPVPVCFFCWTLLDCL